MRRLIQMIADFVYYYRRGYSARYAWKLARATL
jgi:hypothetical protein